MLLPLLNLLGITLLFLGFYYKNQNNIIEYLQKSKSSLLSIFVKNPIHNIIKKTFFIYLILIKNKNMSDYR